MHALLGKQVAFDDPDYPGCTTARVLKARRYNGKSFYRIVLLDGPHQGQTRTVPYTEIIAW